MKRLKFQLLSIFILSTPVLYAQLHDLSGTIMDSRTAKSLPGAIIKLDHKNRQCFSDVQGNFLFDSLPAGIYQLNVFYAGYPVKEMTVNIADKIHNNIVVEMNPPCKYDSARKTGICPVCHKKDKAVPVKYGLPIGKMDTARYYYAGCEVTYCDPSWYCKRDKQLF